VESSDIPDREPDKTQNLPQSPEIPLQGYGPHFEISEAGVITFAAPEGLDRQGNNLGRLESLHPNLRALSRDLVDALGKGNIPHWYLRDRAESYHAVVDQALDQIDFSVLYVEGVRLANAERATRAEKELPPLEPRVRECPPSALMRQIGWVEEGGSSGSS
jgi:hypothetical protein